MMDGFARGGGSEEREREREKSEKDEGLKWDGV